jgi:hypothetical protein
MRNAACGDAAMRRCGHAAKKMSPSGTRKKCSPLSLGEGVGGEGVFPAPSVRGVCATSSLGPSHEVRCPTARGPA